MERLPYIDEQAVEVPADVPEAWRALVRGVRASLGSDDQRRLGGLLRVAPSGVTGDWSAGPAAGATLPGFAVDRVVPGELLSLRGAHRFSRYRLDFVLAPAGPGRSRLAARSWAEFPGLAGAAYRTLVIRSGGHVLAVRRMLRGIARRA